MMILKYASEFARTQSAKALSKLARLHDIITEEVSLVDRAANQRKFLVMKREGDSMDKISEKAKKFLTQGLTAVMERLTSVYHAAKSAGDTTVKLNQPLPAAIGGALTGLGSEIVLLVEAAKKDSPALDENNGARMKTIKALATDFEIHADVKKPVLEILTGVMESCTKALASVENTQVNDDAKGIPAPLETEVLELEKTIKSAVETYPSPEAGAEPTVKNVSKGGMNPAEHAKVEEGLGLIADIFDEMRGAITKSQSPFDGMEGLRSPTDSRNPNAGIGHQPDLSSFTNAKELFAAVPGLAGVFKDHAKEILDAGLKDQKKKVADLEKAGKEKDKTMKQLQTQLTNQTKVIKSMGGEIQEPNGGSEIEEVDINKNDDVLWPADMAEESVPVLF